MQFTVTFTKQDALTFALGAIISVGVELGVRLANLENAPVDALNTRYFITAGIGLASALGRYLATRLPELLASRS